MKNIILGWVLGLVSGLISPWIVEMSQRPYKRSQIKRAVLIELKDLSAKLASVVLQVAMNRGSLDAGLLTWFRNAAQRDPETFKKLGGLPWEAISQFSDEQVKALALAKAPAANIKLNFKRYSLPFLDAHVSALNLFSVDFQTIAHRIRGNLLILNQEIDTTWFYFQKTFDGSLSDINRAIIQGNNEASHDFIGRLSHRIVDDIESLVRLRN